MKGIKLVDVDLSEARTEQTGTCELCFGSIFDYLEEFYTDLKDIKVIGNIYDNLSLIR